VALSSGSIGRRSALPRERFSPLALFGHGAMSGLSLPSVILLPAQPVDATQALNLSAGVSNCKVSRGRSFS